MGKWDLPNRHNLSEDTELRYNPYHDPSNGRFTTADGGGMGAYLFVGRGERGKGSYIINSQFFTANAEQQESDLQFKEAKDRALRTTARYVAYTDHKGKEHYAEKINGTWQNISQKPTVGVYKARYNTAIPDYAKMSKQQLEVELKMWSAKADGAYWGFTRQAHSRGSSYLKQQSEATEKMSLIKMALKRKA